eukprot:351557-Chlamydomonas_euryale.AAC.8
MERGIRPPGRGFWPCCAGAGVLCRQSEWGSVVMHADGKCAQVGGCNVNATRCGVLQIASPPKYAANGLHSIFVA